jgi:hypothetical protein
MAMRCDACSRTADFDFAFCPFCGATAGQPKATPTTPTPPPTARRTGPVSFDGPGSFYTPIEVPGGPRAAFSADLVWAPELHGSLQLDRDGLLFTPTAGTRP